MELKKVSNYAKKDYAKKEEITNSKLKNYTPAKWITASSLGLATILYSSSKNSIYKIGVVFGCIEIVENYNYSQTFNILNTIFDGVYYLGLASGAAMVISILVGLFALGKKPPEVQEKAAKITKILLKVFVVCIVVGLIMWRFLESDAPILYEGGVKQVID